MAVREIKTSIKLDGEKAFEAELRAISQEMRVNRSELRALQSGYDITDDRMGNLTSQARVLRDNMDAQRAVVNALEREYRDAADAYGDTSQQAQGLAIRLNNARTVMNGMTRNAQDLDREIEELGRDSTRAGRQLRDGVGDAAEDASRSLGDMLDDIQGGIDDMVRMSGLSFAMDFAGGVIDFAQGVNSFAEESREFTRQMANLEHNANQAGMEMAFVKEKFYEVAATTGETEGAIEGLANLLKIGFDERELETAIDGIRGAVVNFPDTYKFETLSEEIRKTYRTLTAEGQFAELLTEMGISVDDFNVALQSAQTTEAQQQVILSALNGKLQTSAERWDAENESLKEAEKSSLRVKDAMSELGSVLDDLATPARNMWADYLNQLTDGLKFVTEAPEGESAMDTFGRWNYAIVNAITPGGIDMEKARQNGPKTLTGEFWKWITGDSGEDDMQETATSIMETAREVLSGGGLEAGQQMGDQLVVGLSGQSDNVVTAVAIMVDQINNELSRVEAINLQINAAGGVAGMTGALSGGKGVAGAVIELDGRKVGQMITPYINQNSGRLVTRTVQTQ